ncbi:hypothetical protein HY642_05095 [Candidatus Woesearchaeota archaeon]|nr:hypothetical protein [Candidatus Woesearchaeota archaeon]
MARKKRSGINPGVAMMLELVPGFFSVLGIGHFYNGRTVKGLLFLFGYWMYIAIGYLLFSIMGLPVLLLVVPIALSIFAWSVFDAYQEALALAEGRQLPT